jgi:hypothetical protein
VAGGAISFTHSNLNLVAASGKWLVFRRSGWYLPFDGVDSWGLSFSELSVAYNRLEGFYIDLTQRLSSSWWNNENVNRSRSSGADNLVLHSNNEGGSLSSSSWSREGGDDLDGSVGNNRADIDELTYVDWIWVSTNKNLGKIIYSITYTLMASMKDSIPT